MKIMMWIGLLSIGNLAAQEDMLTSGIAAVHTGFDQWDENQMKQGQALIERALAVSPGDERAMYWLAFAEYRQAIRLLYAENPDEDRAEELIEHAIQCLEGLVAKSPTSDAYALLGSLTGMSILFNPISGMWRGPKSNGQLKRAQELDPTNPRAYYLHGIGTLNTPALFGGGAEKSIPSFLRAVELYEQERSKNIADPRTPHWGEGECLAFTGSTFAQLQNVEQARLYYEKALAVQPTNRLAQSGLKKINASEGAKQ